MKSPLVSLEKLDYLRGGRGSGKEGRGGKRKGRGGRGRSKGGKRGRRVRWKRRKSGDEKEYELEEGEGREELS